ncbi:MAG: ABC transporter permease [Candidatus Zixiibacteriota bacterium]
MLKSYLKVAFRNINKRKSATLINIFSLALGLAGSILVLLYILGEIGYDRGFENSKRIYRVLSDDRIGEIISPGTPYLLSTELKNNFSEVQKASRVGVIGAMVQHGDEFIWEPSFISAEPDIFDIFPLMVQYGHRENLLREPSTVFIAEEVARKYFSDRNPVGEVLTVTARGLTFSLRVTGVIADLPRKSTFRARFIASDDVGKEYIRSFYRESDIVPEILWDTRSYDTYLLLVDETAARPLETKLPAFTARFHDSASTVYSLQALRDIYLHSARLANNHVPEGNLTAIYILSLIAFAILALACINYVLLATAQATLRFKEIGIRKVVGASRTELIMQILSESVMITLMSLPLAVLLIELLLPSVNTLFSTRLQLQLIDNWSFSLIVLLVTVLVGIVSGAYIAFYQSAYRPIDILRNRLLIKSGKFNLRHALVVLQLVIFIVLISCTGVVYLQINYTRTQNPGFDKNNLVLASSYEPDFVRKYELFKNEISGHIGVVSVTGASMLPPNDSYAVTRIPTVTDPNVTRLVEGIMADYDFVNTLGLELVEGRSFSRDSDQPASGKCLLNETAVRELGYNDPLNQLFQGGQIIGVIKDFHVHSFRHRISPLVINLMPEYVQEMAIRLKPEKREKTLEFLNQVWEKYFPDESYGFAYFEDNLSMLYRTEQRVGEIVSYAALLAVVISCLGLVGLSTFACRNRTKEIGIRKVFGASLPGVVRLLTFEYVLLVVLASLLAVPVTYWFMSRWLENFAYRTTIGWYVYVFAGVIALVITMMTVSFQALRAACTDPVKALRYE